MLETIEQQIGDWKYFLAEEIRAPYFLELNERIIAERASTSILPEQHDIYNAFGKCPIDKLKVIIVGQDPYPTRGHANGLAFSVSNNVQPLAKSLQNIFKELASDLKYPIRETGDLTSWAEQGVLLLNTVLTVEESKADSHKNYGWQNFTDSVLIKIAKEKKGCVFILWGNSAQAKAGILPLNSSHLILKAPHPSPLSSYRGFFGSKPFSKANEWLISQQMNFINW